MKAKAYFETPDNIERHGHWKTIDVEIPTADLIAELERRRPCEKCFYKLSTVNCICQKCIYNKADNFKPKTGEAVKREEV
jgi:hypothetical protein